MSDAIDALAGVAPGSFLDELRRRKPVTRDNAQASFDALFAPSDFTEMSALERAAVAVFVAALNQDAAATARYRRMLAESGASAELTAALDAAATAAAGSGPYGHYPAGPLSAEDVAGPAFSIGEAERDALGPRLAAALAHVHMVVLHPRDAEPAHLRALEAVDWSGTGIVTLSQLVSFLSFQIRAAAGLRALDASRRAA